jgi:hypothetical protein
VRIARVRKRDGREVPYDRKKIESAIARAEAAAGDIRPGFAGEVAELVELLLERRFPDAALAVPGIEAIQDQVERALVEHGAAAVAKSYILYREKRAQIRAALLVRNEGHDERRSSRSPRVEARDGVGAWSKGRIVAALMSEADLPRASAEEVASRVEARVFASGLKSISTALVRELVDNELVDLGFEGALRRQRPIGIPRHDLRRALLDPSHERPVEEAVAGEILARYAMEDLLPPSVAERVRCGDLDFEDLSRPHLPLSLSLPCDLLLSGEPDDSSAAALLPEIGRLAGQVSRNLVLEGVEPWIAVLGRAPRRSPRRAPPGPSGALDEWLAALAGIARASGRSVDLVISSPRAGTLEPLLEALAALERGGAPGALPRVFLDATALASTRPAARRSTERLLRAGLLCPCWSAEDERFAGPGLARAGGERGALACGAVAVLNLPRLARRAGAWREDALFEAATELIGTALEGLCALGDFQRESRDRGAPRARIAFALSPVGLGEALAILGDGELRAEQAARLVAFLVEAGERLSRERGFRVSVTPCFGERVAQRFARLDAGPLRVRQPGLFGENTLGEPERESSYSSGFEVPAEAALCSVLGAVPTGALHSPSILRALAAARLEVGEQPLLQVWERLERLRGRTRGGARAIYALPHLFAAGSAVKTSPTLFAPTVLGLHADP